MKRLVVVSDSESEISVALKSAAAEGWEAKWLLVSTVHGLCPQGKKVDDEWEESQVFNLAAPPSEWRTSTRPVTGELFNGWRCSVRSAVRRLVDSAADVVVADLNWYSTGYADSGLPSYLTTVAKAGIKDAKALAACLQLLNSKETGTIGPELWPALVAVRAFAANNEKAMVIIATSFRMNYKTDFFQPSGMNAERIKIVDNLGFRDEGPTGDVILRSVLQANQRPKSLPFKSFLAKASVLAGELAVESGGLAMHDLQEEKCSVSQQKKIRKLKGRLLGLSDEDLKAFGKGAIAPEGFKELVGVRGALTAHGGWLLALAAYNSLGLKEPFEAVGFDIETYAALAEDKDDALAKTRLTAARSESLHEVVNAFYKMCCCLFERDDKSKTSTLKEIAFDATTRTLELRLDFSLKCDSAGGLGRSLSKGFLLNSRVKAGGSTAAIWQFVSMSVVADRGYADEDKPLFGEIRPPKLFCRGLKTVLQWEPGMMNVSSSAREGTV